ncbi:hypothetical protein FHR32_006274 [Streptosporangium album]|uniref:Uncharacterized protein n=1 Tax=Streptosporangium album TaxID=47479 RepID=A0A7W7S2A2_9ACTN|nr:hypothetical protein [Streptosporangium album]
MAFREVSVIEVREVLRAWLAGAGLRKVAGKRQARARKALSLLRHRSTVLRSL